MDIYDNKAYKEAFFSTFAWLPVIYVALFVLRFVLITIFSPLLRLFGSPISMNEIAFVSFAGLRGALSLIMVQTVVSLPAPESDDSDAVANHLKVIVNQTLGTANPFMGIASMQDIKTQA